MESKIAVTAVNILAATETVVGTTDIVRYTAPQGEGLIIRGVINLSAGATLTSVTVRCRRGANTITGAQVGPVGGVTTPFTASSTGNITFEFLDPTPVADAQTTPTGSQPVPGNTYSVNLLQNGGTTAGTVNYATLGIAQAANGW